MPQLGLAQNLHSSGSLEPENSSSNPSLVDNMTSEAIEYPAVFYIGLDLGKVLKLCRYVLNLVRARFVRLLIYNQPSTLK